MNEFVFPEPQFHSIDLVPAAAIRRGDAPPPPQAGDVLQLAEPQVSRLADLPGWIDEDTRNFIIANKSKYDYYVVCITCDFTPKMDERVDKAWISVSLTRSDGGTPLPIARWMDPVRLPVNRKTTRTAKLTPNLQFISAEFGGEEEVNKELLSIVGHPTPESSPEWELQDLPERALNGPEFLKLVIQTPAGIGGSGNVTVKARLRRRRWVLPDAFTASLNDPNIAMFALR